MTNSKYSNCVIAGFMSLIASTAFAGNLPQYRLVHLQSLQGAYFSNAISINENGIIAGASNSDQVESFYPLAVVWLNYEQAPIYIGGRGISLSEGSDVNSSGTVVGVIDEQDIHAYYWNEEDGTTALATNLFGDSAKVINDAGLIAGNTHFDGNFRAMKWTDENQSVLPLNDNMTYSFVSGINNSGTIVGRAAIEPNFTEVGVIWDGDRITEISRNNEISTRLVDINNNGEIIGLEFIPEPFFHYEPFYWNNGEFTSLALDPENNIFAAEAFAINDESVIVGRAVGRAKAWIDGELIDLADQVVAGLEGWTLYYANDINNAGWIVGRGSFDSKVEAFVLIPLTSGDLNQDGVVGTSDLLALLAAWGPCDDCRNPEACIADLDEDCAVGTSDLLILLSHWG